MFGRPTSQRQGQGYQLNLKILNIIGVRVNFLKDFPTRSQLPSKAQPRPYYKTMYTNIGKHTYASRTLTHTHSHTHAHTQIQDILVYTGSHTKTNNP